MVCAGNAGVRILGICCRVRRAEHHNKDDHEANSIKALRLLYLLQRMDRGSRTQYDDTPIENYVSYAAAEDTPKA